MRHTEIEIREDIEIRLEMLVYRSRPPTSGSSYPVAVTERNRARAVAAFLLSAAVILAFWPVLGNGFVNFDDDEYVTANPHVRGGWSLAGLRWAVTSGELANWHPLTWISHMCDVQLFGVSPAGHHATSLLLHLLGTLLLFLLLESTTGALGPSAFAAALFGVHPLHVESVAWIAERKDVLSTMFWLLATLAYVWWTRRPGTARYVATVAALAAGLASKPMLVTLPFTLILLDVWPLGRWAPLAAQRGAARAAAKLVLDKLPLFALSAVSCVVTYAVQHSHGAVGTLEEFSFATRLTNAILSYATYLVRTILPAGLAVFYPHEGASISTAKAAVAGLAVLALTALAIRARRRAPYALVGWLWYLGTLVPVVGLVQVGDQATADRYTYVPLIGIFVAIAFGIPDLLRRTELLRLHPRVLSAAATIVVAALAVVANFQVRTWRDSASLFEHALAVTTRNAVAHNNLALALESRGSADEAAAHYAEAIRIDPRHAKAYNNLGCLLLERGRLDDAVANFSDAVAAAPRFAKAHYNLGIALARQGRDADAVRSFERALEIAPEDSEAHDNLGISLARLGRLDEALAQFSAAVRSDPDNADAYFNWGLTLGARGAWSDAAARFADAIRIRPDHAAAHQQLGAALLRAGDREGARREFDAARKLRFASSPGAGDATGDAVPRAPGR
jgi:protein O-mannosyl-transferase